MPPALRQLSTDSDVRVSGLKISGQKMKLLAQKAEERVDDAFYIPSGHTCVPGSAVEVEIFIEKENTAIAAMGIVKTTKDDGFLFIPMRMEQKKRITAQTLFEDLGKYGLMTETPVDAPAVPENLATAKTVELPAEETPTPTKQNLEEDVNLRTTINGDTDTVDASRTCKRFLKFMNYAGEAGLGFAQYYYRKLGQKVSQTAIENESICDGANLDAMIKEFHILGLVSIENQHTICFVEPEEDEALLEVLEDYLLEQ